MEILSFPDAAIGDEVGVTIEYTHGVGGGQLVNLPAFVDPPTWKALRTLFGWRLRTDIKTLKSWAREKWQRIRHLWDRSQ